MLVGVVVLPAGLRVVDVRDEVTTVFAADAEEVRTALLIGCDLGFRDATVYGAAMIAAPIPIGPTCRLCERSGCLSRAEPPVTRPLGLDEMVTGLSAFDFQ